MMQQKEWLSLWYPRITKELNLDTALDEEALRTLSELAETASTAEEELKNLVNRSTCVVFGAGPSLTKVFKEFIRKRNKWVYVAADGAAKIFMEHGLEPPDVLVTDLDGGDGIIQWCSKKSIMVVHAHGDNINKLTQTVPKLISNGSKIVFTTQTKPRGKVRNYFGFTDGDRAAWLCHNMGADKIILVAMDFRGDVGEYSKPKGAKIDVNKKMKKLKLGEELIIRLFQETRLYVASGSQRIDNIPEFNPVSYI
jgi:uncharacterized Rossmann fold enzyme